MRFELAPAAAIFSDPVFGMQMTGGSSSIKNSYIQYREIGAAARAMLVAAAAKQWQVTVAECHAENGMVIGPLGYKASFGSLAQAAMQQNVPEIVELKKPVQFKLIGKPTLRIDAHAKSNGTQQFGIDFKLPNTKVALVARPPVFGGTVASFDPASALAIKGVIDVFKVPTDRGGSGVAVVAEGYWPAKQACDVLVVKWNEGNLDKLSSDQQVAAFKALAKTPGTVAVKADVSGMANAAKKITAEYEFPYLAHSPMETLNCVVDLSDTACTVWAGSQFQTFDHAAVARTSGLKPEAVTLNTMMAGGGFGRRAVPTSDYIVEAVQVAKGYRAAGKSGPLKVMWSREDDVKGGYYRPSHVHRAEIGFDKHGQILAWDHTVVGQSIISGTPLEKMMIKDGVDETMIEGLSGTYSIPIKISVHNAQANVPVLWYRSVGNTHTAFVMETLIDEAAHVAGSDPVAYRKKLLGTEHPRHVAVLDLAVKMSGYGKTKLPKGHAYGVAVHESFDTVVAYVVDASVTKGVPKLHHVWAAVHCNQVVNPLTIEAQVQGAALMALGTTLPGSAITFKDGVVEQQNFNDYTVARMPDMPKIVVATVPSNDPPTGMGEPGFPPLAPAYANAIAALTGKRLRKLPFDLA
jgi:isoquinoline 1-oxidoreductase beta subunit